MTWFDWTLLAWWGIGMLLTVGMIGRPRKPITPGQAVIGLLITVALAVGLLVTRGVLG